METATLDDFMAWNDELYALGQAGVPIDVDLGRTGADTVSTLEKINATVARRVSQGASLAEALQGNGRVVTPAYASLVQFGLQSGSFPAALIGSNRLAESLDDSWQAVRFSVLYPLIVCSLAYIGFVGFCLFLVPTIETLHRDVRIEPGSGLRILQSLRETLAYWIAIPPLVLLLLVGWQAYSRSRRGVSRGSAARALSWLPGMSRALFQQRSAIFAESLATLLEAGTPLGKALPVAAGACGDAALTEGALALAASLDQGPMLSEESRLALRIPPFLRYALWHAEPSIGRARALRMAASLYRDSAQRHLERLRVTAPLVLCIVLGGGVTLLYGLALFVPVVEMLRGLAS